jgi:hypothetical protein
MCILQLYITVMYYNNALAYITFRKTYLQDIISLGRLIGIYLQQFVKNNVCNKLTLDRCQTLFVLVTNQKVSHKCTRTHTYNI